MELRYSSSSSNGNVTGLWLIVAIFVVLVFVLSFPVSSYYTSRERVIVSGESSLIQAHGKGFSKPVCGAENEIFISFAEGITFTCDSDLQIYTQTWRSGAGEFSRTWSDDHNVRITYKLAEDGPFTLAIIYRGEHLHGSPFHLRAATSENCLYTDLMRVVPFCSTKIIQHLDDGRWNLKGQGWKPFECQLRLFQPYYNACELLRWRNIATVVFIGDENMLDTMRAVASMFGEDLTREYAYEMMVNTSIDPTYRDSCFGTEAIHANSSTCFAENRIPNFEHFVYCNGGKLRLRFLFAWQSLPLLVPTALAKLHGNVLILQSFLPGLFYSSAENLNKPELTPVTTSADQTEAQLKQILTPLLKRPDSLQVMYVFRAGYVDRPACQTAAHLEAHSKRAREYIEGLKNDRVQFYDHRALVKGMWNTSKEDRILNLQYFHWNIALTYMQYNDVFEQHLAIWEWAFKNPHGAHAAGVHENQPPPLLSFEEIEKGVTLPPQATMESHGSKMDEHTPTKAAAKDHSHKR